MNTLIGDIGNTTTKICLITINNFEVKKINYFNSENISAKKFLKKELKEIIRNKPLNKIALFSSVVPKYQLILKKFLKRNYNINLKEIKEKKINKIVKINIKNKKQVGSDRIAKVMDRMGVKDGEVITHSMVTKSIQRAQTKVEARNYSIRKHLLEYDDVMNSQRELVYNRRNFALHDNNISKLFSSITEEYIDQLI